MGIGYFFDHRVSIVRQVDTGALDEYGQPVMSATTVASNVAAGIQPKRVREIALASQAGAAIGDWTIFLFPQDVTEADAIVHDASACPKPAGIDLADGTWQLTGIRNAAGVGHHLEIDATLIESGVPAIEVPSGS